MLLVEQPSIGRALSRPFHGEELNSKECFVSKDPSMGLAVDDSKGHMFLFQ